MPFAAERDITKKAEIYHIEVNNVISYIRGGLVVLNLRQSVGGDGWVSKNAKIYLT